MRVLCAFCFLFTAASEHAIAQTNSQTITNLSEAALVQALQEGGSIGFSMDGTIFVTNTITISSNAVLDGAGHSVTISGNVSGPLFAVSPGFSFTLRNLTMANATNYGPPLVEWPGITLPVTGAAIGGAIANEGNLSINNCIFSNNVAHGGPSLYGEVESGSPAQGGAIYSSGFLAVSNSVFARNSAVGGTDNGGSAYRGLAGGSAAGGAIFNDGGTLVLNMVIFSNNTAVGAAPAAAVSGLDGSGGNATGGAIFSSGGSLLAWNITAVGNRAVGQGTVVFEPSLVGGFAGDAYGAALYINSGTAMLSNCIISRNMAVGGTSGPGSGGLSGGGGIFNAGSTVLAECNVSVNVTDGGGFSNSGKAATGQGGGIFNAGGIQITSSLISSNEAQGGIGIAAEVGEPLGASMGVGGAIYNSGVVLVSESTLAGNSAIAPGYYSNSPTLIYPGAEGGAIANFGVLQLQTTILSSNAAIGLDLGDVIYNTGAFLTDTGSIIEPNVSGTAPFTYDWQVGGTNISDATLPTFNLTNFQFGIAGTNSLISNSSTNSLTNTEILNLPLTNVPSFVIQPTSESATLGALVELSAAAVGFPVPAYEWQLNGAIVTGATASVLLIPDVQLNQAGTYTVIATNIYGTVKSQPAFLTLRGVVLTATNLSNGTFTISGAGLLGMSFILEGSTNLTNWKPIQTNMSPWLFIFSNAPTTPYQFFRAVLAP